VGLGHCFLPRRSETARTPAAVVSPACIAVVQYLQNQTGRRCSSPRVDLLCGQRREQIAQTTLRKRLSMLILHRL
jgi:hypothetical protein